MKALIDFIQQHPYCVLAGAYWTFSAAVSSMPEPMPNGSPGYLWFYRFVHSIAGNVKTVIASKIPGLK